MNKNTFVLLLLLIPFFSVGTNNIETLKDSLSEYSGEDKAKALYQIGSHYYLSNNDSALHYFNSSLLEYEKINDEKEMAKIYGVLGSIFMESGLFDTAVALIFKTIEWGEKNDDELAFYAYFQLANAYDKMDQIAKAQKYYKKAISGNHLQAKLAGFANLGLLYLEEEKYDSASYYFSGGLKEYYQLDTSQHLIKYNIAAIYLNLSAVDFGEGNYEKGISHLKKSLKYFTETGNDQTLVKVYLNLGRGYSKLQKFDLSDSYYLQAKEIADSLQNILVKEEVYGELIDYYREQGDFENALISHEEYEKAHDSLIVLGYHATIAEMEVRYAVKEKNNQIVNLKNEKQNLFIISVSIIGGLLLMSLLIILLINRRRLRQKNARALSDAESRLSKAKAETAEKELERIILSLHEKSAFIEELEVEIRKLSIDDEQEHMAEKVQLLRETRILTDKDWEEYNRAFNEIHPLFCDRIKNYDALSTGDKRQLIFLKLGLKQKEIAYLMGVSPNGVKRARQRLAKRIGLNDAGELREYIGSL